MMLLPYTIKFYKKRFPHATFTIFDNMSTDGSYEYALQEGCSVVRFDTNNQIDDFKYLDFKNNYWRNKGMDWVIVVDCDEWLDITEEQLKHEDSNGVNLIQTQGFNIVGDMPIDDSILDLKIGHTYDKESKLCCFKTSEVQVKYNVGAHPSDTSVSTSTKVIKSSKIYVLRHLHYGSLDYYIQKHLSSSSRNSNMAKKGLANHYTNSVDTLTERHENLPRQLLFFYTCDFTPFLKNNLINMYPIKPQEKMVCVEIGSFEGRGSILICDYLCSHPESRLICIDPFDDEYVKGKHEMDFWNHACKNQYDRFKFNTQYYDKIIESRGISDNQIQLLKDSSINFAYIDGDHSPEQVYSDAVNIFKKMSTNGIVLFDDYLWKVNNIETKIGIDKFLQEYSAKIKILVKNYQLGIMKI
jgi:hypothetical protein